MNHLIIQHLGHKTLAQYQWPQPRAQWHDEVVVEYRTEPILQVEIDEPTWQQMYQLWNDHCDQQRHPAVRDAWEQYQMTKALARKQ